MTDRERITKAIVDVFQYDTDLDVKFDFNSEIKYIFIGHRKLFFNAKDELYQILDYRTGDTITDESPIAEFIGG
jgi:hypothetical protein